MFGLEGSGFVISISLTFLLIGLITYLFRQQINLLEQKFTTIFELTQTLANSIETTNNNTNDSSSVDDNTNVDNSSINCPFSAIKVIDMNNPTSLIDNILNTNQHTSENHDHIEVHESNTSESDTESESDSSSDSDTEENNLQEESNALLSSSKTSTPSKNDIALENNTVTTSQNYNSLKVQELKDLVLKEKLLDEKEIKQLKKQELINILKKSN